MKLGLQSFINCPYPGEMTPLERYTLYNQVITHKPSVVYELGSGEGASTYYIAEAMRYNGFGILHTCDPVRGPTQKFLDSYEFVTYHNTTSQRMIKGLNDGYSPPPDFIFMDGPEDPQVALDDIELLNTIIHRYTMLGCHDWCTEKRLYDGAVSTKARLLKEYMNNNKNWHLVEELSGTEPNLGGPELLGPDSVGLAFYHLM